MLRSALSNRVVFFLFFILVVFLGFQRGVDRWQPGGGPEMEFETRRSPVAGLRGVVATSQPLAANAGLDILKKGGNAIDAAVATAAVLTVVEPMSTSLGGDAFIMVYLAVEQKLIGLNASGRSPHSMTLDALNERLDKHDMDRITGIYSVTVPGAVDGWFTVLEEYGTMSMAEVLEAAIHYAENGFPVSERIADAWSSLERSEEASTRATWLIDDEHAPEAGQIFANKDLARTFRTLADKGRDAFYKGAIAEAIVAYSNQHDGFLTMQDLEDHTSTWVEPIYADYKNFRLYELPPNGQGIAALEMVKILENADIGSMGHNSAEYLHHLIEAKKLAYADIAKWNADPEFNDLPIDQMISTDYAKKQFGRIDKTHAMEQPESGINGNGDTVLLEVMDKDNNAVSFIYSLYSGFGSGLVAPGTGFTLQNRGAPVLSRAWARQRGRAEQETVSYHYSRHGVRGRRVPHDFRGHGRRRSAPATRSDLSERRRVRDERSAGRRVSPHQSRRGPERHSRAGDQCSGARPIGVLGPRHRAPNHRWRRRGRADHHLRSSHRGHDRRFDAP